MAEVKKRVLVAEDDDGLRETLIAILDREYEVTAAPNGDEAVRLLQEKAVYDVVVSDFEMGEGATGVDVVRAAVNNGIRAVILMTGNADALKQFTVNPPVSGVVYKDKEYLAGFKLITAIE